MNSVFNNFYTHYVIQCVPNILLYGLCDTLVAVTEALRVVCTIIVTYSLELYLHRIHRAFAGPLVKYFLHGLVTNTTNFYNLLVFYYWKDCVSTTVVHYSLAWLPESTDITSSSFYLGVGLRLLLKLQISKVKSTKKNVKVVFKPKGKLCTVFRDEASSLKLRDIQIRYPVPRAKMCMFLLHVNESNVNRFLRDSRPK